MRKRTTIGDVALKAGVGKVTVSYVLNGQAETARISRETAERVIEAAKELNYLPNALARAFVRQRTDSVGVVYQEGNYFASNSAFISEVMRGICDGCNESDLDVVLHTRPTTDVKSEADSLTGGRVDGLLMLKDSDDPVLQSVVERRFPLVLFFTRMASPHVAWVDGDNYSGGRMGVDHMASLGHRRIGVMIGPPASVAARDRLGGYRGAMESHGLPIDPRWVVPALRSVEQERELFQLMSQPDRPTAWVCWSDDTAIIAIRRFVEMGLSVPQDVSVMGFDSTEACDRVTPPLTSVRQPIAQMARTSVLLLKKLIDKEPIEQNQIIFPLTLDLRASTAPAPTGGPLKSRLT
jgi:DNA-binding LacI/PurR family transcriptional regulator